MYINDQLDELIKTALPEVVKIRHQLHQIPELKYEEVQTASLIAATLTSYGCMIKTGIAKTGVVAIIDSGKPGKTVALRADIDALPIHEATSLPYQSKNPGKMHACGHDGHTATLLLVAYVLQKISNEFNGKVKLIFQPAEEGGKGSLAMIEDGVLEDPAVDAIFGYHNWPGLAIGEVGTRAGSILMGAGRIEISLVGRVAHTAMPQHAINPVVIGSSLVTALTALQKKYQETEAILNVIRFESGNIKGGMTDTVKITAVYYIESNEVLLKLKKDINTCSESIVTDHGATFKIDYFEFHKPTINTQNETLLALKTAREFHKNEQVIEFDSCKIAAEDFSEYLLRIPGCFFLVGAGKNAAPVHTEGFVFPDEIIPIAAKIMCKTVINFLTP